MGEIGIYTLANDSVIDQLIALINSIEVNISPDITICVIPYNEQLDLVIQEVKSRENVILYDNWEVIKEWDNFAEQIWAVHPAASHRKSFRHPLYQKPLHRKLVAFHGDFEKFVFYDADSLAMKPLNQVWEKLEDYDFIFDDWEHKKPREVAALDISGIEKSGIYQEKYIRPKLHCSSFFGSKRGIFEPAEREYLKNLLIQAREVEWIRNWWDDAFLFNYMTLRCERLLLNFTLSSNGQDRTGNCANADPFVTIDNVLYNKDGLKPIHRIHYMSYSSSDFARLCQGEDVNIHYRDEFLYYHFLKEPDKRPKQLKQPSLATRSNRLIQKSVKKLQRTIA